MLADLPRALEHDGGVFESGEPPDPPLLGFRRGQGEVARPLLLG